MNASSAKRLWLVLAMSGAVVTILGCIEKDEPKPEPKAEPAPVVIPPEPPRSKLVIDPKASYAITTAEGAKCLQFGGGSKNDGAQAEIATCNGSKAQELTFVPVPGGYQTIVSANSGKCLDVQEISLNDGARAQQYLCNAGPNQTWIVADAAGDTVRFVAKHSGKVLDVSNGGSADGTSVTQQTWKSAANQQFKLKVLTPGGGAVAGGHPGKESGSSPSKKGHKQRADGKPASAGPAH